MSGPTREQHHFPTRQYVYFNSEQIHLAAESPESAPAGGTYRFILGRDAEPVPLSAQFINDQLHDPFARLVLTRANAPVLTARALLGHLDQFNAEPLGLPVQAQFVVADGGQILWKPETDGLNREIRFAITRSKTAGRLPDLLISTSSVFDDESTFLQVIGWDPDQGAYQFYERRSGSWIWAGNSWDAFDPKARGHGPFDSHINGALNMKELKQPWVNWHSEAASVLDDILAKDDALRHEPLWTSKSEAQDFERVVIRPGIDRWTAARFSKCTKQGRLTRLPEFFRQVLETTTVNLVSSFREYRTLATGGTVDLPLPFFFNTDLFLGELEIEAEFEPPTVSAELYRSSLERFDVHLADGSGTFRFPGDTYFVFVVPEAAHEDNLVTHKLVDAGVLSKRLAGALHMVDFANPVFSRRRAALLKYVPESARTNAPEEFDTLFVQAVLTSGAAQADSPESEFLGNWNRGENWPDDCARKIQAFIEAVRRRLGSADGFKDIFALAESRRREFRRRPLAEFRLTTPVTNIPEDAPFLEFAPDASIRIKP
jgi:hypothetical protein